MTLRPTRRGARARDLARLATLLDAAVANPAPRARLESADPAVVELARAIDRHLDADLARDFERRAADERFREQLAALSHDIRTPLAGAQGYLQLARRTTDPALAARYLDSAAERLAALRVLTDDLFTYARAADPSFEPELEPCDLAEAVADALAGRYEAFAARGWEPDVRLGRTEAALAAPDALARVIANLLENVLAHGAGAPTVCVGGTTLTISNPMDADDAAQLDPARLTERFYQGDSSRAGHGSGLGLAVARALAESMGASFSVDVTREPPRFSARLELRVAL